MDTLDGRIQQQLARAKALQAAKNATIYAKQGTFAVPAKDMGQMPLGNLSEKFPMLGQSPYGDNWTPWAISLKHLTSEQRAILMKYAATPQDYPTEY